MHASSRDNQTLLAVPITADTVDSMGQRAVAAARAGADLIEFRFDWLTEPSVSAVQRLLANKPCPAIATVRAAAEGGKSALPDAKRIDLLKAAALAGAHYIDLEYATWHKSPDIRREIAEVRKQCATSTPLLILSMHDFERTPANLDQHFADLAATDADIIKCATHAQHICDTIRMLEALRNAKKPAIGLCMGLAGVPSRILAPKAAAALTFCSLQPGAESAPGQVPIADMLDMYRFKKIAPDTPVLGVVGDPVGHSMSPALHNAAYRELGIEAVYLPLEVADGAESFNAFADAVTNAAWLGFAGLSVTIPHKINALDRAGWQEPLAVKIGAANTLHLQANGQIKAYNTDYTSAIQALCDQACLQLSDLVGKTVAVLGAGGVSRAVVAGLINAGCKVLVYNRTAQKAKTLAEEFACVAKAWDERADLNADIVVNCTSLGMWPKVEATPLPEEALQAGMIVFDTVYNPPRTRLLQEAANRGCKTVDGIAMFVHQAAGQMQHWFGRSGAFERMRQIVLERLGQHS